VRRQGSARCSRHSQCPASHTSRERKQRGIVISQGIHLLIGFVDVPSGLTSLFKTLMELLQFATKLTQFSTYRMLLTLEL
jgi:hypothetical protein